MLRSLRLLQIELRHCSSHVGSSNEVRVRFAPSPTGHLHLGGLRTALYNYLFARNRGGKFILRIEDTDQTRLVPGSVDAIHRILNHYGLDVDEGPIVGGKHGPYVQSQRLPLYQQASEELIDRGHAYRCFCSEERLELLRKDAARRGAIPMYDRRCRSLDAGTSRSRANAGEKYVIRFKLDKQNVAFEDEVFGPVEQCIDESDMILLKSDGFPTYHLANVVDDRAMRISHVIRGMEWLSSTGKHAILYRAFDSLPPRFVHLSLITRDGKKKLSKRDKDAYVDYYDAELGALPIAVLNLMVRNGSGIANFDSNHLYSLEEMIQKFDVSLIGKRNLQLDSDCFEQYGRMAFQAADVDKVLIPKIKDRLVQSFHGVKFDDSYVRKVIDFLRSNEERFAFLSSLSNGEFRWFFTRPTTSGNLTAKFDAEVAADTLSALLDSEGELNLELLKTHAKRMNLPYQKLLAILRLTLIDSTKGPPIMELIDFFGEEECRNRMTAMLQYLVSHKVRCESV